MVRFEVECTDGLCGVVCPECHAKFRFYERFAKEGMECRCGHCNSYFKIVEVKHTRKHIDPFITRDPRIEPNFVLDDSSDSPEPGDFDDAVYPAGSASPKPEPVTTHKHSPEPSLFDIDTDDFGKQKVKMGSDFMDVSYVDRPFQDFD